MAAEPDGAPGGAADPHPPSCGRPLALEQQAVDLSDEMRFVWHRPPMDVVERQWQDPTVVRIFVNGCFDLMHVGHFNALRQAKHLFYQKGFREVILVAGLHSDVAIAGQKGPPLMTDDERVEVLRATKWVDEMATGLPYAPMSAEMADALRVTWICHGDDLPVCKTGDGMYSDAMERGRFQLLKRTEGISTTQILERLLQQSPADGAGPCAAAGAAANAGLQSALVTTQRLAHFAAPADPALGARSIGDARRVVYVSGAFDLLHGGHVCFLQQAAKLGDYLLVGVHSDDLLRQHKGARPILTLFERAMMVLAVRGVDDVVLGAPWVVSQELLTTMNVAVVATSQRGRKRPLDGGADAGGSAPGAGKEAPADARLAAPVALGLVARVDVRADLSSAEIRRRAAARRAQLAERNGAMLRKELQYVEEKRYVPEA